MAKEKAKETPTLEVAVLEKEDSGVPIVLTKDNGAVLDTKNLAQVLNEKKFEHELKVTGEYFQPELGEEVIAMFVGRTKIAGITGEEVPAVRLLLPDESVKVTASAIINSALAEAQIPSPVKIVKTGEKKVKSGILNLFDVWLLS